MTKEQEVIKRLNFHKEYARLSSNRVVISETDLETVLSMLKEKDRQIDLMAEEINETNRGYKDYCKFKIICDRNCKSCIKQYFERKSKI